ncbi:MAG: hypothetical protein HC878_00065 [Leptolyngbyaceae cyanobacterium SL_5_14]|nr:hypothetical protein [Leptolyngbyaceae cyanobacterium SL_5_14]
MQICNIVGNLEDIGLGNINGLLQATLVNPFIDETSTPHTLILPSTRSWEVVGGELLGVSLRETESINQSVLFEFFPEIDGSEYSDIAIYKIEAIIPNLAEYNFAQLLETGISQDTLATGALRVAQVMFSDPSLIGTITEALNIFRQSVPPASVNLNNNSIWINPATGDQWGYSETKVTWLSFLKESTAKKIITTASQVRFDIAFNNMHRSVVLRNLLLNYAVTAPNDAENFWVLQPVTKTWTSEDIVSLSGISARGTGSDNPDTLVISSWNLNRDLDLDLTEFIGLTAIPTGSPGTLRLNFTLQYRTIFEGV